VDESTGLENRRCASARGFESLSLRQSSFGAWRRTKTGLCSLLRSELRLGRPVLSGYIPGTSFAVHSGHMVCTIGYLFHQEVGCALEGDQCHGREDQVRGPTADLQRIHTVAFRYVGCRLGAVAVRRRQDAGFTRHCVAGRMPASHVTASPAGCRPHMSPRRSGVLQPFPC
jgi:hypothetical protein